MFVILNFFFNLFTFYPFNFQGRPLLLIIVLLSCVARLLFLLTLQRYDILSNQQCFFVDCVRKQRLLLTKIKLKTHFRK